MRPPTALALAALALALFTPFTLHAQQPDYARVGTPLPTDPADPAITAALQNISADHIRATIEHLVSFGTRNTLSSTEPNLPPGTGATAAGNWIHAQFAAISETCNHCLDVHDDTFTYTPPAGETPQQSRFRGPTPLHDVYAILRGSDPAQAKRMVLVTGHYDSRVSDVMNAHSPAPGANDDASGTAVSLECARVLSHLHLPATLVFVSVAGEEQGLTGSEHLAQLAKREGWQLEGVLNNDIVGGDTTPGDTLQSKNLVRVFSQGLLPSMPAPDLRTALLTGADNDTPSRQLAREVLATARTYTDSISRSTATLYEQMSSAKQTTTFVTTEPLTPVMVLRLDRYLRGGDHSMFSAAGFPAVRFTEWRENFNHQHQDLRTENNTVYGDLLQFDDFTYIARVARLNAANLATLAASPGIPQHVRVVTHDLDNNTTLHWSAPLAAGPNVHYQIVWRETTANDWQYAAPATNFPTHTTTPAAATSTPAADGTQAATLPISKDNVFFGIRACDPQNHCSQAVPPDPER